MFKEQLRFSDCQSPMNRVPGGYFRAFQHFDSATWVSLYHPFIHSILKQSVKQGNDGIGG